MESFDMQPLLDFMREIITEHGCKGVLMFVVFMLLWRRRESK